MRSIADELIVVDTGSTDRTTELAKNAGAQVYFYEWQEDFSAAKNFALQQATGEWILFLDADEYFTEATVGNVRSYLEKINANKNVDAFLCQMFNVDEDQENRLISAFQNVRIFRKDSALFYYNKVHELLVRRNGPLKLANLDADVEIYHTGYSTSVVKTKLERNLNLIKKEISENGEHNWHYAYLADCYYGLKDYEKTIEYARKSIQTKIRALGQESTIYRRLIDALFLAGKDPKEILKAIEEAIVKFPREPEFIWNKAAIYFQQKNYIVAEKYLKKIVDLRKKKSGKLKTGTFENREYLFFAMWGDIFQLKNKNKEAAEQYYHALELNKYDLGILTKFYRLLRTFSKSNSIEDLCHLYPNTKRDNEFLLSLLKEYPLDEAYIYITKRSAQVEINDEVIVPDEIIHKNFNNAVMLTTKKLKTAYGQMIEQLEKNYNEEEHLVAKILLPRVYQKILEEKLFQEKVEKKIHVVEENRCERMEASHYQKNDEDEIAMEEKSYTSIIIPVYNQLHKTKQCVESIRASVQKGKYELILIDNGSNDGTAEWLDGQCDIQVISNQENRGFAVACNQGMRIARGTEILLLQNDALVMGDWLEGLQKILYSQGKIGAVGPVFFGGYLEQKPSLAREYGTIDELKVFAAKMAGLPITAKNVMFISSLCMLVKREILDCVGELDEQFSPGYMEDMDYSFRILKAGYRLAVAENVFIYHEGGGTFASFGQLREQYLAKNEALFKAKWGFNPTYSANIRHDLLQLVNVNQTNLTILDVGCACGANLLHIKSLNKTAQLYGVELNERAADIASCFAEVSNSNVESLAGKNWQEKFDYILMGDILEHLYDPWKVVKQMRDLLQADGCLVVSLPNIMHISVIKDLLQGNWEYKDSGILDRTHLRFFTKKEIETFFAEAGFEIINMGHTIVDFPGYEEWLEKIAGIKDVIKEKEQFEAYQWIILAKKKKELQDMSVWIKNWSENENDIALEKNILHRIQETLPSAESLYRVFEENILQLVPNIIRLAALLYQESKQALAIQLLIYAYKENSSNSELIYALAFFLNLYGEAQEALKVLRGSKVFTSEMKALLEEIETAAGEKKNR